MGHHHLLQIAFISQGLKALKYMHQHLLELQMLLVRGMVRILELFQFVSLQNQSM